MKTKLISFIILLFVVAQIILSIIVAMSNKQIPIHWNGYGEINAYGSSYNVLFLTLINILSYVTIHWLSKHPEICNFPRPFKNQKIAFHNMTTLLNWVSLNIAAIILYITIGIICNSLQILIIYILTICLIYITIAGIIKLYKS